MMIAEAQVSRLLLDLAAPVLPIIGKLQVPLPRLMGKMDYESFMASSPKPGLAMLARKRWQATNVIIPGWWKHAAMYVGTIGDTPMVVEAIWPFVRMVPAELWFHHEDYALCRSPNFLSDAQMSRAASKTLHILGLPYDVRIGLVQTLSGHPAFYCAEVYWWCVNEILKEDGITNPFEPRLTAGIPAVSPNDIAQADKLWADWWKSPTLLAYEAGKNHAA